MSLHLIYESVRMFRPGTGGSGIATVATLLLLAFALVLAFVAR